MRPVFAVDVGGVLASLQHDGDPMPGCKAVLEALEPKVDLWVVSMCGRDRAAHTRAWICTHELPFAPSQQLYVSFKEEKLPVLQKIKAKWFVDDRTKHINPAREAGIFTFHFGPPNSPRYFGGEFGWRVNGWPMIAAYFKQKGYL